MKRLFAFLLVTHVLAFAATTAVAQAYPNRVVKVVVPFGTGATSDIVGRMIADRLTVALGQPFLVENRTGAGGTIGTEFVAKSPNDGYTLLVTTAATPISASVFRNLKYDTAAFTSITVLTHSPLGFAANPQFPPKTVSEFIEYAKANPGKVNYGSLGVGTSHHLTGEKLKLDAGIDMVHVPYKGSGRRACRPHGRADPGDVRQHRRPHAALQVRQAARWPCRARSAIRCCRRCRRFPKPA